MKKIEKRNEIEVVEEQSLLKKAISGIKAFGWFAISAAMMAPASVYAAPKLNTNLGKDEGMGAILSIIFSIAQAVGGISLVMGIFMTVQSFMSDNPEKRNQGVTLAIVGAVLMGLEALLKTAGILA